MSSINKVVNNVLCSINPALLVSSTPSGFACDFSNDPAINSTISISFDTPITQFTITLLPSPQTVLTKSHTIAAINSRTGQIVDSQVTTDLAAASTITVSAQAPFTSFDLVQLIPYSGDSAFYSGIGLTPILRVAPGTPIEPPSGPSLRFPSPITAVSSSTINLSDIIIFSKDSFTKQYIKGTLTPVPSDQFTVSNTSTFIDVQLTLDSPNNAVLFNPSAVTLTAGSTATISINFNAAAINMLPTGLNTFNDIVTATSTTPIISITPIPSIPIILPRPTIPIPIPLVVPFVPIPSESSGQPPGGPALFTPVATATPVTSIPVFAPFVPIPSESSGQPPGGPTPFSPTFPISILPVKAVPIPTGPEFVPPPVFAFPAAALATWINGLDNSINVGAPPAGWIQQSDGSWVPVVSTFPKPVLPSNPDVNQIITDGNVPTPPPPPPSIPGSFSAPIITRAPIIETDAGDGSLLTDTFSFEI